MTGLVDPPVGCVQVSDDVSKYESHIATEKGLVELGRQMGEHDIKKHEEKRDRMYLNTVFNNLADFSDISFMSSLKLKNKNTLQKISEVVSYIPLFSRVHQYYKEDILSLQKEIDSLKVENTDLSDVMTAYIVDLEEVETKLVDNEKRHNHTLSQLLDTKNNLFDKTIKQQNTITRLYHFNTYISYLVWVNLLYSVGVVFLKYM